MDCRLTPSSETAYEYGDTIPLSSIDNQEIDKAVSTFNELILLMDQTDD